ncbi:M23 family metallopeptidase [Chitinibacteraceae bacterium HSL-7]
MNIILVSSRAANVRHISPWLLGLALLALLGAAAACGMVAGSMMKEGVKMPSFVPGKRVSQVEIDAMAVKLGELQAKLTRLDGLARQVGEKTGIDIKPFLSSVPAPRGGAMVGARALTADQLAQELSRAEAMGNAYADQLTLAEDVLLRPRLWQLPARLPMQTGLKSSSFGFRLDPFTGRQTFHEGIDFVGPVGTPINAVATGTVVTAEYHPQYGNMVELSHDNGLTTRYAHASRLLVKVGDHVKVGQLIAEVGSTGRSTGPHLHFEVRYKGVAQNPLRFLPADVAVASIE